MTRSFKSFKEFYPFYLSEHQNTISRRLHFIGTSIVIFLALSVLFSKQLGLLLLIPLVGYGFAWVGHFFFEHNRPATFSYPFYSLMGDFRLFYDMLTGKQPF